MNHQRALNGSCCTGARTHQTALLQAVQTLTRDPIQRVLLVTDGTVTEILEAYLGESMRLVKLSEEMAVLARPVEWLALTPGEPVIRRRILLRGALSHTNHLYAESIIALDRLDDELRDGLLLDRQPIGFLLQQRRLETYREILEARSEVAGPIAAYFAVEESSALVSRTYRVFANGQPLMLITEKFPERHFAT